MLFGQSAAERARASAITDPGFSDLSLMMSEAEGMPFSRDTSLAEESTMMRLSESNPNLLESSFTFLVADSMEAGSMLDEQSMMATTCILSSSDCLNGLATAMMMRVRARNLRTAGVIILLRV